MNWLSIISNPTLGLTPHKRKALRNPRVKHRLRYEAALRSRRGQVRDRILVLSSFIGLLAHALKTEDRPYIGEATGINPLVVKSVAIK